MQRRTDTQILHDVREALVAAPVDELAIQTGIHAGVVELRGEVATHSERLAAMTAAKEAATPARVTSLLSVAPLGTEYRMTDADIAVEVARALVHSDVPPGTVWFDVADHIVTLQGRTPTAAARSRIRHLVQRARGVHFIDNRIVVDRPALLAPARTD